MLIRRRYVLFACFMFSFSVLRVPFFHSLSLSPPFCTIALYRNHLLIHCWSIFLFRFGFRLIIYYLLWHFVPWTWTVYFFFSHIHFVLLSLCWMFPHFYLRERKSSYGKMCTVSFFTLEFLLIVIPRAIEWKRTTKKQQWIHIETLHLCKIQWHWSTATQTGFNSRDKKIGQHHFKRCT